MRAAVAALLLGCQATSSQLRTWREAASTLEIAADRQEIRFQLASIRTHAKSAVDLLAEALNATKGAKAQDVHKALGEIKTIAKETEKLTGKNLLKKTEKAHAKVEKKEATKETPKKGAPEKGAKKAEPKKEEVPKEKTAKDLKKKSLVVSSKSEQKAAQIEGLLHGLEKMFDKTKNMHAQELKRRAEMKHGNKKETAEFDQWDGVFDHMFEKQRAFDHMIHSKLANAVHLLKKGALDGNTDAKSQLSHILGSMQSMTGNFVH